MSQEYKRKGQFSMNYLDIMKQRHSWDGTKLTARLNGSGFFSKVDLGIVKCDFELASGHTIDN